MKDALDKLLGSSVRVKTMRLFLQNPSDLFDAKEISRRCKINKNSAKREISFLEQIGFVKQKTKTIDSLVKLKNGKIKNKKQKIHGFGLNESFYLLNPLRSLFIDTVYFNKDRFVESLKNLGDIRLAVLSGIFMQIQTASADLLVVGNRISKLKLEKMTRRLESETGKEIIYTFFDTKEFLYRFSMYDRFLRDILDFPHEKVINKLNI